MSVEISLVVAASENDIIGKDNQLLWHLPNDMKFFKNVTWAMPVIMGRKTFESLGKPLAGRTNIIITRQKDYKKEGALTAANLSEAMDLAAATDAKQAYVIGGGEIFAQSIKLASRIFMTRVHTTLDGDASFPPINPAEWRLSSRLDFSKDEKHAYDYSFELWERQ